MTRVVVMENGTVVDRLNATESQNHPERIERYLGIMEGAFEADPLLARQNKSDASLVSQNLRPHHPSHQTMEQENEFN